MIGWRGLGCCPGGEWRGLLFEAAPVATEGATAVAAGEAAEETFVAAAPALE